MEKHTTTLVTSFISSVNLVELNTSKRLSLMFATTSHQWPPCRTGIITWEKKGDSKNIQKIEKMRRRKNDLTKNMKKIQNKDTNHINFIQTEFDGGMMELLLKQFNVKTIYFHVILVKKIVNF